MNKQSLRSKICLANYLLSGLTILTPITLIGYNLFSSNITIAEVALSAPLMIWLLIGSIIILITNFVIDQESDTVILAMSSLLSAILTLGILVMIAVNDYKEDDVGAGLVVFAFPIIQVFSYFANLIVFWGGVTFVFWSARIITSRFST